uniref:Cation/H+ exchanger protein 1 n=1 Tax=Salmo trutta TaxID=8032 RepID=A0A674DD68_SALTR
MSHIKAPIVDTERRRRRSTAESSDAQWDHDPRVYRRTSQCDRLCVDIGSHVAETPSPDVSHQYTPKFLSAHKGGTTPCHYGEEVWQDGSSLRTTIRAENEVEANKLANNYRFGFRKWKSHVTERPIEDRSDIVRELYSELNFVRPQGSLITCGNMAYLILFGWWISLAYLLICVLMFLTIIGVPYGKLCWKLSCYFLWPFGKSILKVTVMTVVDYAIVLALLFQIFPRYVCARAFVCMRVCACLLACLVSCAVPCWVQCRVSTYVWLLLGYPLLGLIHGLACFLSWILVFTIPVAKMNARTLAIILLMPPEDVHIHRLKKVDAEVLLCCYHAFNWYYYKYTLDGINVFAVNLLPLVITTLVVGYVDTENQFVSSEAKFAAAVSSIIPLSYYIGMGIASISAQSNFAVGAVVNATFGSITEMTFYITALLRGHKAGTKCYEEIVKAALTGTLLGCILFIPGISMIIGGFKHREQRFNSRSAGVSSALLFISVGGVFAPTLFSKAYGSLVCAGCSSSPANTSGPFTCLLRCSYLLYGLFSRPLVYTISVLLPSAYLIGLIFTLKTHSHIYDIQVSDGGEPTNHKHFIISSFSHKLRALSVLIMATLLMAACADLTTEHIKPILDHSAISQYFIGVTVLAMVPEIPEIFNGIQFALQNNISLSLEVGNCIAVQVCMIQIPLLILFNTFYDVGFVLLFSDLHLWASIFSVIVVNYIFMDGKSDYFQGTALVVVYLILLALYFFAPSPRAC